MNRILVCECGCRLTTLGRRTYYCRDHALARAAYLAERDGDSETAAIIEAQRRRNKGLDTAVTG